MSLSINGVPIDDPLRPYVIAEMSGNHNQDYAQAERLVVAAAEAGADAIKVQTFTPEEICADIPLPFGHSPEHDAWLRSLGVTGMRELFAKGGFPRQWHVKLKRFAERQGIEFLSTPFSPNALNFLVYEVGVHAIKIASGDLTNTPLLVAAAESQLPILLSTGGATDDEIYAAVTSGLPMFEALRAGRIAILHCVSIYPCPEMEVNLRAIESIRSRVKSHERASVVMGFSDHTLSVDRVPGLAIAAGATFIEKHIRLEDDTTSIDAAHSLTPGQFATMVIYVQEVALICGHGRKEPQPGELHDRLWGRRDPSDWLRPTMAAREGRWE